MLPNQSAVGRRLRARKISTLPLRRAKQAASASHLRCTNATELGTTNIFGECIYSGVLAWGGQQVSSTACDEAS
jgi:hypothetical protein